MDFRLSIDFDTFTNSTFDIRKSLIFKTIIRAIDILSTKKGINKNEISKLKMDVEVLGKDKNYY